MKFQNISSLLDEKWTKIPKAGQKGLIEREGVENLDGKCPFLMMAWFEMENKSKLFDEFCDWIFWVIGAVFSTEKKSGYQYQIANSWLAVYLNRMNNFTITVFCLVLINMKLDQDMAKGQFSFSSALENQFRSKWQKIGK